MIKFNLSIREIQKLETDILSYFHELCEENGLRYYLAWGTLIGAIRHSGFIPWDDDIDVMMPRNDYYKLVDIMLESTHPYYKLVSFETNPMFTAPLPKIIDCRTKLTQHYDYKERVDLGIYMDIFLLDGAMNSYEDALKWYEASYSYYRQWRISDLAMFPPGKSKIYGLLRYIKNIKYKIHDVSYYLKLLKNNNSRYTFDDCIYVSTLDEGNVKAEKNIWEKNDFEPKKTAWFENAQYYIPRNYDKVLRTYYGDYMQMPPEELRQSNHNYTLEIEEELAKKIEIERRNANGE